MDIIINKMFLNKMHINKLTLIKNLNRLWFKFLLMFADWGWPENIEKR